MNSQQLEWEEVCLLCNGKGHDSYNSRCLECNGTGYVDKETASFQDERWEEARKVETYWESWHWGLEDAENNKPFNMSYAYSCSGYYDGFNDGKSVESRCPLSKPKYERGDIAYENSREYIGKIEYDLEKERYIYHLYHRYRGGFSRHLTEDEFLAIVEYHRYPDTDYHAHSIMEEL